jgi:hypothetical protein
VISEKGFEWFLTEVFNGVYGNSGEVVCEAWLDVLLSAEAEEIRLDSVEDEVRVPRVRVQTFEQAGVLSTNHGLVVQVGDQEFQITIVRSR